MWLTILIAASVWILLYLLGKSFSIRDKLQKADVVVCLAGTRGSLETLHERIETAIDIYKKGYAEKIIMSSMFSKKVSSKFNQIRYETVKNFAKLRRITEDHVEFAFNNWDLDLGADYMKKYALKKGVPENKILVENKSLHTKENAEFTLKLLVKNKWKSIILVTSPFHQKRAFETFHKVMSKEGIKILNYSAHSIQWNDYFWFLSMRNIMLVLMEYKRIFQYRN